MNHAKLILELQEAFKRALTASDASLFDKTIIFIDQQDRDLKESIEQLSSARRAVHELKNQHDLRIEEIAELNEKLDAGRHLAPTQPVQGTLTKTHPDSIFTLMHITSDQAKDMLDVVDPHYMVRGINVETKHPVEVLQVMNRCGDYVLVEYKLKENDK